MPKSVFLNSKEYIVAGSITDLATPEWTDQIRITGIQKSTDRRDISTHNFGDVSYGVGRTIIRPTSSDPREILRFEDSTSETRFPGQTTLPGLLNTASQAANTGKIVAMCNFLGSLRAVSLYYSAPNWTAFLLTFNSSTNTWDSTGTIATAANTIDEYWAEAVVMDNTMLVYLQSARGGGLYKATDPTSWAAVSLTGGLGNAVNGRRVKLLPFGSTLFLAFNNLPGEASGQSAVVYTSTDMGTNVTARVTLDSSKGCLGAAVFYNRAGTLAPFFLVTSGLYLYDTTTNLAYKVIDYVSAFPSFGMVQFGDFLFIPLKNGGITRVGTDWSLTSVGLDLDSGLPSDRKGEIVSLLPCGVWLLCAMAGDSASSYASIWALDLRGWHHIFKNATLNQTILAAAVSSYTDGTDRLHIVVSTGATTSTPFYINSITQNPLNVSNFVFASSSYIIYPRFDGDMPETPAGFYRVYVAADSLTTDETVVITYGLDNAAVTTTTLGTASSSATKDMPFGSNAGVTGTKIQLKAALARGDTTTLSPVIRDVSLQYLKIPLARRRFRFTIDVEATATDFRPAEAIIDELYTLLDSPLQVNFQLGNLFNGYIRVQDVQAIDIPTEMDSAGSNPKSISRAGLQVTIGEML